ncbi:substrate-binding domain-containing protein [Mucilaginibacter sp. SMC90]|uniref:LacI family DNA-binding transcriptional regulator n=1 Tax=Mucilaginibacter sp. SMC90 TaxID=2929803 RepID=UPI001FB1E000|nr:substrate-binding domain-containing protein [Mucilaginibacter sp. SMC90]UOE46617.1 substrate-binding domain-containing protein [Mucilaginibacter sp. SMC90]
MKESNSNPTGVKEIARLANVSIGTVDRVIHNRKGVSDETRKKVNAIIEELNFRPNKMASLLARRNQVNIGVLIPKTSSETNYWSYPLAGITQAVDELKQFGISVIHFFYDSDSKNSFADAGEQVLAADVQGVLLAPSFIEESLMLTKKLSEGNIPFVFINSDLPRQESLSYIGPDLFQSGRLAAQIISMMAREADDIFIVNISTELELDHHLLRKEQGFRRYFEEHSIANTILTLNINHTDIQSVKKQLSKALVSAPRARVLFVTNSRVNVVARVLADHPQKLILIGYDFIEENIRCLENESISFIISQRPKEQGYLGIMALYKHLFGLGDAERTNYMPIDIITKENFHYYKN